MILYTVCSNAYAYIKTDTVSTLIEFSYAIFCFIYLHSHPNALVLYSPNFIEHLYAANLHFAKDKIMTLRNIAIERIIDNDSIGL